jgi:hAT family C-terminal dimerisation region
LENAQAGTLDRGLVAEESRTLAESQQANEEEQQRQRKQVEDDAQSIVETERARTTGGTEQRPREFEQSVIVGQESNALQTCAQLRLFLFTALRLRRIMPRSTILVLMNPCVTKCGPRSKRTRIVLATPMMTEDEVENALLLHNFRIGRAMIAARAALAAEDGASWRESRSSPLECWATITRNSSDLRMLTPYVKGMLGAPCVSSSSESVFSVAGDVLSCHRSQLSGEHARQETLISLAVFTCLSNLQSWCSLALLAFYFRAPVATKTPP